MSPQLIILLLQEIAANGPAVVAAFQKGEISAATQQELFNAVENLSSIFDGPEWKKSTDV